MIHIYPSPIIQKNPIRWEPVFSFMMMLLLRTHFLVAIDPRQNLRMELGVNLFYCPINFGYAIFPGVCVRKVYTLFA